MRGIKTGWFAGIVLSFTLTTGVLANPSGGSVAAGSATIQQTPTTTTVNQSSQRAVINWQSFNIGSQEHTHFQQPTGGVALNRISPVDGASQIYGRLTATGQIILVNPAGIYFGPGAYVNVGGLIATTSDISNNDFMAGNYHFNQPSPYANASIINKGTIIAANHGLVALVGQNVTNDGVIQANLGKVVLASGDAFTVNFSGDGMINFAMDAAPATRSGNVTNTGSLIANGGTVMVTAKQASAVLDRIINLEGIVEARSVYKDKGEVIISGDPNAGEVRVAANIDTSGTLAGETGGTVNITGYNIMLDAPTLINASGNSGGGTILVGGNYRGQGPLPNANAVVMAPNASLHADALTTGNGGQIVLWADNVTRAYGTLTARGGSESGDGGFIETSGKNFLDVNGISVSTRAPHGKWGTWLLDPTNIFIALNQGNATAAGMVGADTSVDGSGPLLYVASGAVQDSLLTTATLNNALDNNGNITVSTVNAAGTGLGNITVVDGITWTSTNSLTLQADNNIIINAGISGVNGSLNLSAVNAAQSITTGASGTINVANFNLLQGQWFQAANVLPAFNVSNDFQINSGVIPVATTQFLRSASATGVGTVLNPYVITDVYGLQGIGSNTALMALVYNIGSNINAASTATWNSGQGFVPIGFNGTQATAGTINGLGNTISNLTINRPGALSWVGLITTLQGTITNLSLTNVNISGGGDTGAVAGLVQGGTISATIPGMTITGSVTGLGNFIGGVAGNNDGTISASAQGDMIVDVDVSNTGSGFVGGLAGYNNSNGNIINLNSAGTVFAPTSNVVGGLAGLNDGDISNSFATGNVTGASEVGGLIGNMSSGTLISTGANFVFASGNVSGSGNNIGGLIGANSVALNAGTQGFITASGTVTGTGAGQRVGGLIGYNNNSISNFSYTGTTINASTYSQVGGLVGFQDSGNITNSFSTGNVSGGTNVGGLVGQTDVGSAIISTNTNLTFASGNVTGSGNSIGGLVGQSQGAIAPASQGFINVTGTVTGTGVAGSTDIGGFVGLNHSSLLNVSYTSGSVFAPNYDNVGGLVGRGINFASVTDSFASVNVTGRSGVGGLIGTLQGGSLTSSNVGMVFASGNVSGSGSNIGGLIGRSNIAINATAQDYITATGTVTGTGAAGNLAVGGLVGFSNGLSNVKYNSSTVSAPGYDQVGGLTGFLNAGTITNSFSTVNVSGRSAVGGLVGQVNVGAFVTSTGANQTFASGNVTGSLNSIGGLVGLNQGSIAPASQGFVNATGIVSGSGPAGSTSIGGMIGLNHGTIANLSYTSNPIFAPNYDSVGGLVGQNINFASLTNSFSTVNVTGRSSVGGLVGSITNGGLGTFSSTGANLVFASGNVSGSGSNIGGLIGSNTVNITPASQGFILATGTVTGTGVAGSTGLGGLFGSNTATLSNLTNNIAISNTNYDRVGGIVGNNTGAISNSYNSASITGRNSVGGIAGNMTAGSISSSYNTANIIGRTGSVGGIVGAISTASLSEVYNIGNVLNDGTTAGTAFGGLVGTMGGGTSLTNSYNSGYVSGTIGGQAGTRVGGLIGSATFTGSTIGFLYNTGFVQGSSAGSTGGLVGFVVAGTPTFSGTSYFNTGSTGQTNAAGNFSNANLIGATTAQMAQQATYTGWDFATIWDIDNGSTYPWLRDFYSAPRAVAATSSATGANPIGFYLNGALFDSVFTGADGSVYFLEGNNLISGVNKTIADGDSVYLFFNQNSPVVSNAVAFAPGGGGHMGLDNGLTLTSNTLTLGLATTSSTINNAQIASAVGAEPHALFTTSGNDLILNNGISLDVTAPTTYSVLGNLTISGGSVNLSGSLAGTGNPFTLTIDGGTNNISGVISNVSSFIKEGAGTLILSGANTYTGSTIVNDGTLIVSNASGLGTTAGGTTVNTGAVLTLNNVNIGNEGVTLNNATMNSLGNASLSGAISLQNGTSNIISSNGTSLGLSGAIDGNATLTMLGTGLTLSSNIGSGTALSSLIVNTVLNLGGNVSMSGNTLALNVGVIGGNSLALNGTLIGLSGTIALNNLNVTGTGVTNTFGFNSGTAQDFNITGIDVGNISNAGIAGTGSFGNIQNLGGTNTADNQFIFANNARMTGTITGGNTTTNMNTLDYSAYATPVVITLTADKFIGSTVNAGIQITDYTNINNIVGNGAQSLLILTAEQLAQAQVTGPLTGFVGDPLFWSNISVNFPQLTPSSTPTNIGGPIVSPIIQQPESGSETTNNNSYFIMTTSVDQNIAGLVDQAASLFDTSLSDVSINPYCYQAVN